MTTMYVTIPIGTLPDGVPRMIAIPDRSTHHDRQAALDKAGIKKFTSYQIEGFKFSVTFDQHNEWLLAEKLSQ